MAELDFGAGAFFVFANQIIERRLAVLQHSDFVGEAVFTQGSKDEVDMVWVILNVQHLQRFTIHATNFPSV
ncbi:MAG: hypothetical protein V3V75_03845, partial [Thermoguttaceae bacterium]